MSGNGLDALTAAQTKEIQDNLLRAALLPPEEANGKWGEPQKAALAKMVEKYNKQVLDDADKGIIGETGISFENFLKNPEGPGGGPGGPNNVQTILERIMQTARSLESALFEKPEPTVTPTPPAQDEGGVANTKILQTHLKALGYDIGQTGRGHDGIDGAKGPLTNKAFINFCVKNNLDPDEINFSSDVQNPETAKFLQIAHDIEVKRGTAKHGTGLVDNPKSVVESPPATGLNQLTQAESKQLQETMVKAGLLQPEQANGVWDEAKTEAVRTMLTQNNSQLTIGGNGGYHVDPDAFIKNPHGKHAPVHTDMDIMHGNYKPDVSMLGDVMAIAENKTPSPPAPTMDISEVEKLMNGLKLGDDNHGCFGDRPAKNQPTRKQAEKQDERQGGGWGCTGFGGPSAKNLDEILKQGGFEKNANISGAVTVNEASNARLVGDMTASVSQGRA